MRRVVFSERPRPPLPRPLEPGLVTAVREAGWEILPSGWAQRRLADIIELRQQLECARAAAVPRDPTSGPQNATP
jgi:hypothetical protein